MNVYMLIMPKQVRTQQIHEMKKKEKEYIKLQVMTLFVYSNPIEKNLCNCDFYLSG